MSDKLLRELKELGFSIKAVYDVHNIIDTLKNHRRELIDRLTANLPDEEKKTKTKELNEKIDRILPQLTMIASWLGTKRVILDFYLKAVPKKKPLEYVGARIRASSDCTVPSSPYAGFERHTVPIFFSSNAGVYAIMATLTDTVKI